MVKPCFFDGANAEVARDHLHNYERWLGAQPSQIGPGSQNSLTGFRVTSNATANVFGNVITVFDGTETPTFPGMHLFDFHRIIIVNVQNVDKIYRIRFANNSHGATSWANGVAINDYSDIACVVPVSSGNKPILPIMEMKSHRFPSGTTIWAAVATADSVSQYIDFLIGIHEYTK